MADECRSIECRPCGEETEFGMFLRGKASIGAGADFVHAFDRLWPDSSFDGSVAWDADARIREDPEASGEHSYFKNKNWLTGSNILLPNGARFYLDGGHAEISTPLCLTAHDCVLWNRACYAIIDRIRKKHKETYGKEFIVYRNNVAGGETSYGNWRLRRVSFACHENYAIRRAVPCEALVRALGCGWFPARIPIIGAGKVGSDHGTPRAEFQMSQRADFMTCVSGIETMADRGIYNLRDVPYADRARFRRMHVICGDSNMCAIPEFLKIALTDIILKMIEDGALHARIEFSDPVGAMRSISRDLECAQQYDIVGRKKRMPILDILSEYRDVFAEYVVRSYPRNEQLTKAIGLFSGILSLLKCGDSDALVGMLDWATKRNMIAAYCGKKGIAWESDRAVQLDCEYSNNDHESGIWFRRYAAGEECLIPEALRRDAERTPPLSRSRLIVNMLRTHASHIEASNYWDRIIIKKSCVASGERYIFLPDPTRVWDPAIDEALMRLPLAECIREGVARGIFTLHYSTYEYPRDAQKNSDSEYRHAVPPPSESFSE